MATRMSGKYLMIYTADRSRILGELSGATWEVEQVENGVNHLFSGIASDGTYGEFLQVNAAGIDHVAFDFEGEDGTYSGQAILLRPSNDGSPGGNLITVETGTEPKLSSTAQGTSSS